MVRKLSDAGADAGGMRVRCESDVGRFRHPSFQFTSSLTASPPSKVQYHGICKKLPTESRYSTLACNITNSLFFG